MRIIKHILAIVIVMLTFIPEDSTAQARKVENLPFYDNARYHFGFVLAFNQMHFSIKPVDGLNNIVFDQEASRDFSGDSSKLYSVEHQPTIGFTVGIITNLRLGNYFDLRLIPSLAFGERYLDYRIMKYKNGSEELLEINENIPSTYVEFPLQLKYKSQRLNNFRAYVLTGLNYRIDLASQANKNKDISVLRVKLVRNDLSYEVGVGFDFYFEWFKFGTEVKMSYGIPNILFKENSIYSNGIEKLSSKIFQMSFTFE